MTRNVARGDLSSFDLVDQLPTWIAALYIPFDHREQSLSGTSFFPQRPHEAFLVGIVIAVASKVLALVASWAHHSAASGRSSRMSWLEVAQSASLRFA
jgi:hypothetical protein